MNPQVECPGWPGFRGPVPRRLASSRPVGPPWPARNLRWRGQQPAPRLRAQSLSAAASCAAWAWDGDQPERRSHSFLRTGGLFPEELLSRRAVGSAGERGSAAEERGRWLASAPRRVGLLLSALVCASAHSVWLSTVGSEIWSDPRRAAERGAGQQSMGKGCPG